MAELSDEQKMFLVRRRAHCVDIPDIVDQFFERFGEKIKPAQVSAYDATTVHGRERLGVDLQALFHEERRKYLADDDIPIASQNFWIKELDKMYFALTPENKHKSDKARMAIIELSAKIKGGLFKTRVSEQEAIDYVLATLRKAREAVDKHVTNPDERNRVNAAIQKDVEGQDTGSGS